MKKVLVLELDLDIIERDKFKDYMNSIADAILRDADSGEFYKLGTRLKWMIKINVNDKDLSRMFDPNFIMRGMVYGAVQVGSYKDGEDALQIIVSDSTKEVSTEKGKELLDKIRVLANEYYKEMNG